MTKVIAISEQYDIVLLFRGRHYGISSRVMGTCHGWTQRQRDSTTRVLPATILVNPSRVEFRHVQLADIFLPRIIDPIKPYTTIDAAFQQFLYILHEIESCRDDAEIQTLHLARRPVPELALIAALCHSTGYTKLRNLIDRALLGRIPIADLDLYYFTRGYGMNLIERQSLIAMVERLGSLIEHPIFGVQFPEVLKIVRTQSPNSLTAFLQTVRIFARLQMPVEEIFKSNCPIVIPEAGRVKAMTDQIMQMDMTQCSKEALGVVARIRVLQPIAEFFMKVLFNYLKEPSKPQQSGTMIRRAICRPNPSAKR